jgi:hypothetical protein
MTPDANPQQISYKLIVDPLIGQMSDFFAIRAQANLTLIFSPHSDS